MNRQELNILLSSIFPLRDNPPTVHESDLNTIEQQMNLKLPQSFRTFLMELPNFRSSGGFLGAIDGDVYTDKVSTVFEAESMLGWNHNYIPIYDVGNGEFYVVAANEGDTSRVYYVTLDRKIVSIVYESFDDWLRSLHLIVGTS